MYYWGTSVAHWRTIIKFYPNGVCTTPQNKTCCRGDTCQTCPPPLSYVVVEARLDIRATDRTYYRLRCRLARRGAWSRHSRCWLLILLVDNRLNHAADRKPAVVGIGFGWHSTCICLQTKSRDWQTRLAASVIGCAMHRVVSGLGAIMPHKLFHIGLTLTSVAAYGNLSNEYKYTWRRF